ncbi:MAG TPA: hypothetical protein VGL77_17835 [Armatimonadota bacterium]|jgi:hypothetical protein
MADPQRRQGKVKPEDRIVGVPGNERRAAKAASIICENPFSRLCVIRNTASLGLALEACSLDAEWSSLRFLPEEDAACPLRFYAYDPLQQDGETHGVSLQGVWGDEAVTLTAVCNPAGIWCRIQCEIAGEGAIAVPPNLHRWLLRAEGVSPEVWWPPCARSTDTLSGLPAAFVQSGSLFAALVRDFDEIEAELAVVHACRDGQATLEYQLLPSALSATRQFAYQLCLDARAVPGAGYQQLIRMLGEHEAFKFAAVGDVPPLAGPLPPLPAVLDEGGWLPFMAEGAPEEIAALVCRQLDRCDAGDWQHLDEGLRWLDRLCYCQQLCETPGGMPFGSFGDGAAWDISALWMPPLLFRAFALTGNPEYANRGIAAIGALPPRDRALVLWHLYQRFGDIYIHADCGEAILAVHPDRFQSMITPEGLDLQIVCAQREEPLRLVLDGSMDSYALVINGEALGVFPTAVLREGIDVPLTVYGR